MPETSNQPSADLTSKLGGRSIVLVGMMGCGKTAIGRITADYMNLPFFDADEEIEKAAGMNVTDIFNTFGEAEFRSGEAKVIARLLADNQSILALGGGAFLSDETREIIRKNAISIWLRADVEVLYSRVRKRPGKRPLLQTDNPRQTLIDLLEQRNPTYAKADIVVDTSITSKMITRNSVVDGIDSFLANETNATDQIQ